MADYFLPQHRLTPLIQLHTAIFKKLCMVKIKRFENVFIKKIPFKKVLQQTRSNIC